MVLGFHTQGVATLAPGYVLVGPSARLRQKNRYFSKGWLYKLALLYFEAIFVFKV